MEINYSMHLSKFVRSDTGIFLVSVLLGLGLATLFKQTCKGKNCITYMAPSDITEDDIYKYDGTCFKPEVSQVTCDKNKDIYSSI